MSTKYVFVPTDSATDWSWLLRVPVKQGDPVPMEILFMYHANTLLPMLRKFTEAENERPAA